MPKRNVAPATPFALFDNPSDEMERFTQEWLVARREALRRAVRAENMRDAASEAERLSADANAVEAAAMQKLVQAVDRSINAIGEE